MSDTSLRYLIMLQLVPRYPSSANTIELQQKLSDAGFEINLRSIQRDLEKLSGSYPLICDESSRPFKWSYSRDASMRFLPALDLPSAITLELAKSYLTPLLPPKVLNHLKPHFEEAERVLKKNGNAISHWPDKIRLISRGLIGKRPDIESNHLEILTEAILNNQECHVLYQSRAQTQAEPFTIRPLGLVYRDPNTYILAEIEGKETIRQLLLHRFESVEKLTNTFKIDFDIDDFIEQGEMHILRSREIIKLSLLCNKPAMLHLLETPLDNSQVISNEGQNTFELNVTLKDTSDLRWWLIAQSEHVKIVEPVWLTEEIMGIRI